MDPLLVVDALLVGTAHVALVSLLSRLLPVRRNDWAPLLLAGALLRLGLPSGEPDVASGVSATWAAAENAYYQQKGCRMVYGSSSLPLY